MGAYHLHKQPGWKLVHKHKTTQIERVGERYTKYRKIIWIWIWILNRFV